MLISMLFKALLIYFAFKIVRGLYRGYKVAKALKESAQKAQQEFERNQQSRSGRQGQVFEAEFRHVDRD